MTSAPAVACLGLGGMGAGIARVLISAGVHTTVFNRSPGPAERLGGIGACVAETAAAAVENADVVLMSVSDAAAERNMLFASGAVDSLRPSAVIIDASTVSPEQSRELSNDLAAHGIDRIEACLIGNPLQASQGTLRILVGGEEEPISRARPILDLVGRRIDLIGPVGSASVLKLVFNALLGCQIASLAEAVALGRSAGLSDETVLQAVGGSGFSSTVMDFRADLMLQRRWEPAAFRSKLMAKDLGLALELARQRGVEVPVLAEATATYSDEVTAGRGELDAASVLLRYDADEPGRK